MFINEDNIHDCEANNAPFFTRTRKVRCSTTSTNPKTGSISEMPCEIERMMLPQQSFSDVYHVGSLNKAKRSTNRASLEANALSVSHCPEAWTVIAELGEDDTWRLWRMPPSIFLVATSLNRAEERAIREHMHKLGYLKPMTLWRSPVIVNDNGDEGYMLFETREEAVFEADGFDFPRRRIRSVASFKTTPKLDALLESEPKVGTDAEDYALIGFARLAGYDGLWWHESHDPDILSAPRGALFYPEEWERENIGRIEVAEFDFDYEQMHEHASPIRRRPIPKPDFV